MSKHNPNQDYYKIGGRDQSDGPDKLHADREGDKRQLAEVQHEAKSSKHPAVQRAKKK